MFAYIFKLYIDNAVYLFNKIIKSYKLICCGSMMTTQVFVKPKAQVMAMIANVILATLSLRMTSDAWDLVGGVKSQTVMRGNGRNWVISAPLQNPNSMSFYSPIFTFIQSCTNGRQACECHWTPLGRTACMHSFSILCWLSNLSFLCSV